MPKNVFNISTATSAYYFARDALGMASAIATIAHLCNNSQTFAALPFLVQALALAPLQFVGGFFMWCMFVVGHDCGHTTFSPHQAVNEAVGELAHSLLLCTPFAPWRRSHHRHHSYHNHIKEDYSHMWYVKSKRSRVLAVPHLMAHYTLRVLTPFVNWWVYLYVGLPDGGHLFLTGRLWKGATRAELARGYASSVLALIGMGAWYSLLGDTFVRAYCLPWMWYGWWLFTVTFFQHHYEEMLLFREGAWSYVRGAFETIDRTYGFGIDDLHHNITDGHVLHHIFFTKVPHYHLSEATVALKRGLAANGFSKLYQHAPTPGFGLDIFRFLHKHWFWVDDERVVTAIAGKAPPAAKKVE